jgi:hypothetical protein
MSKRGDVNNPSSEQLEEFATKVKSDDRLHQMVNSPTIKRVEYHTDNTPQKIIYYSVSN